MRRGFSIGIGALLLVAASTARAQGAAPPAEDHGRLRAGFNFIAGAGIGDGSAGPIYGATVRVGWQISHKMAAFAQGSAFGWASSERGSGGITRGSSIGGQLTPAFAYLPTDAFELALGPSLDRLLASYTVVPENPHGDVNFRGWYFGLHGRAALHVGNLVHPDPRSARRSGLTLGLDLHPTYIGRGTILFASIGIGADWY